MLMALSGQSMWRRASAGRRREARRLPTAPATRPPSSASADRPRTMSVGLTGASSATSVADALHRTLAERPERSRGPRSAAAPTVASSVGAERGDHERADEAENDSDGASEQSLKQRLTGHLSHDEASGPAERLQRAELAHRASSPTRASAGWRSGTPTAGRRSSARLPSEPGEVLRIDERS